MQITNIIMSQIWYHCTKHHRWMFIWPPSPTCLVLLFIIHQTSNYYNNLSFAHPLLPSILNMNIEHWLYVIIFATQVCSAQSHDLLAAWLHMSRLYRSSVPISERLIAQYYYDCGVYVFALVLESFEELSQHALWKYLFSLNVVHCIAYHDAICMC